MLKRITFHSVVVVLIGTSMALFAGGCATPTTPVQDGDDGDDSSGRPVAVSIFDNNNSEGVRNGPTAATQFTITQSRSIASIETYHWNGGAGTAAPGTVSIRDANGNLVGTWNCTGRPSEGTPANLYWVCTPNIELPAGTYTVEDSDPSTWSCNSASGDAGICSIMASALGDDDTADDDADDPADDANDDADDLADDDSDNDADDDGGDDPDDVDESTPEAVAEQFFERQVAGDTEGMLDLCALHLMSDDDIAESKAALNVIRDRATLSDHSFTHLATGYDAERTSALVRCRHTMTVTADGVSDTQEAGTLFWMILHDGSWKIRNLYPDELVALAVAEKHGVLTARVQNASGMYTWQEVNERFNSELMTATLDTGKLALDTYGSAIGAKPVTGDALSWWYTVGDMVVSAKETADDYENGRTKSTFWGVTSVGWGFVQLAAEIVPGADHASDAIGAALDQIHNWQQQKENYLIMLKRLKNGDFSAYRSYPILRSVEDLPDGIDIGLSTDWFGTGYAVKSITILNDGPVRRGDHIVFDVGTMIAVREAETPTYYSRAVAMGAPVTTEGNKGTAWLGARITDLIVGDGSSGAGVLEPVTVDGRWANYRFTSARGTQSLVVKVHGFSEGSAAGTEPATIDNLAFNAVDGITVGTSRGTATTELVLKKGETLSDLHIYGTFSMSTNPLDSRATEPDLTLINPGTFTIDKADVAAFAPFGTYPNGTLSITGVSEGSAWLNLQIASGSADTASLDTSVLITVEEDPGDSILPYVKKARSIDVSADLGGWAIWASRNCEWAEWEGHVGPDYYWWMPTWTLVGEPIWTGATFTLTDPNYPGQSISGLMSADGRKVIEVTATYNTSEGTSYTLTLHNIPVDESRGETWIDLVEYYVSGKCGDTMIGPGGTGEFSGHRVLEEDELCEYMDYVRHEGGDMCLNVEFQY